MGRSLSQKAKKERPTAAKLEAVLERWVPSHRQDVGSSSDGEQDWSLELLLMDLFSPAQLRNWLRDVLDLHLGVDRQLRDWESAFSDNPPASHYQPTIDHCVQELRDRNAIDKTLFRALRAERPRRFTEIQLVQEQWLHTPAHYRLPRAHEAFPGHCIGVRIPPSPSRQAHSVVYDFSLLGLSSKFLDSLYFNYLGGQFPISSYGTRWVLQNNNNNNNIVAPLDWVARWGAENQKISREWMSTVRFEDFEIEEDSVLEVVDLATLNRSKVFVLAAHEDKALDYMYNPKGFNFAVEIGFFESIPFARLEPKRFAHYKIVTESNLMDWLESHEENTAYVQSRPLDSETSNLLDEYYPIYRR